MCSNEFILDLNEQISLGPSYIKTFIEKLYLSLYPVLPPIYLLHIYENICGTAYFLCCGLANFCFSSF